MNTVTVIMATYNGEKYIDEQIKSVLAQENVIVNLLIRDDGSSTLVKFCNHMKKKAYYNIIVENT